MRTYYLNTCALVNGKLHRSSNSLIPIWIPLKKKILHFCTWLLSKHSFSCIYTFLSVCLFPEHQTHDLTHSLQTMLQITLVKLTLYWLSIPLTAACCFRYSRRRLMFLTRHWRACALRSFTGSLAHSVNTARYSSGRRNLHRPLCSFWAKACRTW